MKRNFRSYQLSLTANQEFNLNVSGNMYAVIDNTGEFTITFDDSNRIAKATGGTGGEFQDTYQRIALLSTTTQTVTVIFGFGKYHDARATVNATVNTTIEPSDTFNEPGDVTVGSSSTQIVAASTARKEVMIHLPSSAGASVRIGSATVTAAKGIELEPGSTISLAAEMAVYGIRTGGSDEAVSVLELRRP